MCRISSSEQGRFPLFRESRSLSSPNPDQVIKLSFFHRIWLAELLDLPIFLLEAQVLTHLSLLVALSEKIV